MPLHSLRTPGPFDPGLLIVKIGLLPSELLVMVLPAVKLGLEERRAE